MRQALITLVLVILTITNGGGFGMVRGSYTHDVDQQALIKFWKELEDVGELEWNMNEGLCGQQGIGCDSAGKVINLFLMLTEIRGTISSELGRLTNLEELWLQENHLTGTIPTEFGKLENLIYLFGSFNELTGYPSELGNLRLLSELHLDENNMTGTVHTEFGELHNLMYLQLSKNQLTGTIPTQLGRLKMMNTLNLSNNRLIGSIPPELEGMKRLYYLHLDNNHLTGTVPGVLEQLPLVTLKLGGTNHFCPIVDYGGWSSSTGENDFEESGNGENGDGNCAACAAFTCANGGVCHGGMNEVFRCECAQGFSGANCEKEGNEGPKPGEGGLSGGGIAAVVLGVLVIAGLSVGLGYYLFVSGSGARRSGSSGGGVGGGGSESRGGVEFSGGWHPLQQDEGEHKTLDYDEDDQL